MHSDSFPVEPVFVLSHSAGELARAELLCVGGFDGLEKIGLPKVSAEFCLAGQYLRKMSHPFRFAMLAMGPACACAFEHHFQLSTCQI